MATFITCGTTGRNFSTLAAAVASIPATPTGGYEVQCYKDSEFTAGCSITGHTTSAVNYIRLTAAAGESFQDHASVRTNALFYDATKGVGVTANTFSAPVINVADNFVTVDRLQIKRTGSSYGSAAVEFAGSLTSSKLKDCIVAKTYSAAEPIVQARASVIINCLVYDTGATASNGAIAFNEGGTAINCTVARAGATGGTGISNAYNPTTLNNCAVFGWTTITATASGSSYTGDYNATSGAAITGAHSLLTQTYASCFISTTTDFKLAVASPLIDHGNTDATNAPNDITGLARGAGTAGDIGAWETASAATIDPGLIVSRSAGGVLGPESGFGRMCRTAVRLLLPRIFFLVRALSFA